MPWCPRHARACRRRGSGARRNAVRRWAWPRPLSDLVEPAVDCGLIDARDIELGVTNDEHRDTHDIAIQKSGIARHVDSLDVEALRAAQAAQPCERFIT